MARRSRYLAYVKGMQKREERISSPVSILKRLQELKDKQVVVSFPIGENQDEKR